jgi:pyridoxine 5-phosphate synthase
MIRLHVNVDHVATVRNARGTPYPDPVFAAELCLQAGADGITAHLREDRRHITDDDVMRLRRAVNTVFNLEMAATAEMAEIAARVRPDVVTLVPERREERTTEGGLDVASHRDAVLGVAEVCGREGIKLSLFIEAEPEQIAAAAELGARQVELHTGEYCRRAGAERARELTRLARAAEIARKQGLEVAAGHGLTRHNVVDVAAIAPVVELNIGHAVVSDAVLVGMERAVAGFRAAMERGIGLRR